MNHRSRLPQLDDTLFLTDGGLETDLVFNHGIELPEFSAFDLLKDDEGTATLRAYYPPYLELAAEHGTGFVLETPTWRANPDWAQKIGYDLDQLDALNRKAVALMEELRGDYSERVRPLVISGCVGPQDDGYSPEQKLSAEDAQSYHSIQVGTFADTAVDLVTAITMTYAEEGIGVARAAQEAGLPSVISFTVETDGRLPSGQPLGEAIEQVEEATGGAPAYFMINCAHPTHFDGVLDASAAWAGRVRGLRANASTKSHAELDESTELDPGDPEDLGARYAALREQLPALNVLGGCCGTDQRHVTQICEAWVGRAA